MAKRSCPIDPEDFSSGNPDRGNKQGRGLEGFYQSFGSGCLGNPDYFIERKRENESGTMQHPLEGENQSGSAHHFMDPGSGNSWGSDICGMY